MGWAMKSLEKQKSLTYPILLEKEKGEVGGNEGYLPPHH
jgi:hypothetical protein